jgi:hypothetical protein
MLTTWEAAFQEAVHEPDPMMAEAKIRRAEAAIFHRIHHFSANPGSAEVQALFDALGTIRSLRLARQSSN